MFELFAVTLSRKQSLFGYLCHDVYEQCGDGPAEEKHRKYFDSKRGQREPAKHESRDTLPTEHLL